MASKRTMDRVVRTQERRSERAKSMDARRDSKTVYDKPTNAQANAWMRDPSRSDIRGIDTKTASKPKGKTPSKTRAATKKQVGGSPTPSKVKGTAESKTETPTKPSTPEKESKPATGRTADKATAKSRDATGSKRESKPKVKRDILRRTVDVHDTSEYEAWLAAGPEMDPARSGVDSPEGYTDEVIDYSEEYDAYHTAMGAEDIPAEVTFVSTYEPDDFEEIDRKKGRIPGKRKRERRTPTGEYSESHYRKLLGKGDDPAAYSAVAYAMMGEGEPIEGALEYLIDAGYEDEAVNSRWKWDSRETNSAFLRKKAQEVREQELYYAGLSGNRKVKGPKGPGYFREPDATGSVRIPLEVLYAPVRVMCGGDVYDFDTRDEAIREFRGAVAGCEGSEQERYRCILEALLYSNLNRVSDGIPVRTGGRKG